MTHKDIYISEITTGKEEETAVLNVLRSRWQAEGGKYTNQLEKKLADLFSVKYVVLTNSGSSANLLALAGLNLKKNSIVLSSAGGFSATLAPIIHLGYKPYLVDFNLDTLNVDIPQIEYAVQNHHIDAVLIAHNMGSVLDMDYLMFLKNKYNFKLTEDACESYLSLYNNKAIGSFGEVGTLSFYASHTLNGFGGGGAILIKDDINIYNKIKSLKSWGKANVINGESFTTFDTIVDGIKYHSGYVYPEIGFNMRIIEAQAAYLTEQLKRLFDFVEKRRRNYLYLEESLKDLPLHRMKYPPISKPAFFAYPIVLQQNGLRDNLVEYLEKNKIHTRLYFAGNLLRHPGFKHIEYLSESKSFPVSDFLMTNACFCGIHQNLTLDDMEYISQKIKEFFVKT